MVTDTGETLHAIQLECEIDQLRKSLHQSRLESHRLLAELEATSARLMAATEYRRYVHDLLIDRFTEIFDPYKFNGTSYLALAIDGDWPTDTDLPVLVVVDIEPTEMQFSRELQFVLVRFSSGTAVYEVSRLS